jgi:para-aminobenzoate synthetase / 4-amino-4-deoxychorismate lyase
MNSNSTPVAVLYDSRANEWLEYGRPLRTIAAYRIPDVLPALKNIETAVNDGGLHAAGFIGYEAAPAFDAALDVRAVAVKEFPLIWFGLFEKPRSISLPRHPHSSYTAGTWKASMNRSRYRAGFTYIKKCIGRGETYQTNYSLRLRAPFRGNAWAYFTDLARAAQAGHCAYIDTGRYAVCSVSPELFFRLNGASLESRPMKGTVLRGRFPLEDEQNRRWLESSDKNRAENVMIVDMIRNDMGKIAQPGSVRATRLFRCERFPTVWQMTSTVKSRTRASVAEIFSALFPCASVTGAPKVSTMQILSKSETSPRRVYCGCIGSIAPRRKALFNVAIRTVFIDRASQTAEYGVGGGVVWQSSAREEYEECMAKARVLSSRQGGFSLLESILWQPGKGYYLLNLHLARLAASARYFGFHLDMAGIGSKLTDVARTLNVRPVKVRLLVDEAGSISCGAAEPVSAAPMRPVRLAPAGEPVDSSNIFLFHKTTNRTVYDAARKQRPDADDVVLWNERGEITETCTSNIVVKVRCSLVTPPVACGLLAGTFRRRLLGRGTIAERILSPADLRSAGEIYIVNSVRKWRRAVMIA